MMALSVPRRILLGAWLGILTWPYAAASGVAHPLSVALLPLGLAALSGVRRMRLPLQALLIAAVIWLLLFADPLRPPAAAHLLRNAEDAQRLILSIFLSLTVLLGWQVYRQADSTRRTFLLMLLGAVMLVLDERLWYLYTAPALISYLGIGLLILALTGAERMAAAGQLRLLLIALVLIVPPLAAAQTAGDLLAPSPTILPPVGVSPPLSGGGIPKRYRRASGTGVSGVPGPGPVDLNQSVRLLSTPLDLVKGAPPGIYWVVATYATFNGTSWIPAGGPARRVPIGPQAAPPFPVPFTGVPTRSYDVTVAATSSGSGDALLYAGQPEALLATNGHGPVLAYPASRTLRQAGASAWQFALSLPVFPAAGLRSAPWSSAPASLLPDLKVPRLPAQVLAIARSLRAGAEGPFDLAVRVRAYLQRHETYSTTFPKAPPGDVVGAFLLESHRGYCDQFSTAFVMLMRLGGVPTRWVVGYGPGQYDQTTSTTLLRAEDAHSWAEVFVKGYGWVPMDPTPPSLALAPAERPSTAAKGRSAPIWILYAAAILAGIYLVRLLPSSRSRRRRGREGAEDAGANARALLSTFDRRLRRLPHQTLRDALLAQDSEVRDRLWPVVALLEGWLYAGRTPSPKEIRRCWRALHAPKTPRDVQTPGAP